MSTKHTVDEAGHAESYRGTQATEEGTTGACGKAKSSGIMGDQETTEETEASKDPKDITSDEAGHVTDQSARSLVRTQTGISEAGENGKRNIHSQDALQKKNARKKAKHQLQNTQIPQRRSKKKKKLDQKREWPLSPTAEHRLQKKEQPIPLVKTHHRALWEIKKPRKKRRHRKI